MFLLAKYATQTVFTFPIPKAGSTDLAATGDWTPATGDTKVSKDGGNVANSKNNPAAVGGTGSIMWTLTLTATELTAAVIDVQIVDSATKAVTDQTLKIYTYGNASAKIPLDLSDLVRAGLTALPNAAAEASGGLYTRGSGAGQIAQSTNGQIDVDAKKINAVATTSVTTVSANVGTTQPINFTGTAGSALAKSDMVDVAGAAVSTSTAQIGANTVNIGGTAQTTGVDLIAKFTGITRLSHWLGAIMGKQAPDSTAQTEIRASGAGSGTYDATTDSQEAVKDAIATTAEVASAVSAAIQLKKNTAFNNFCFTIYLSGTKTAATGKTITCQRLLDADSAYTSMTNSAAEVGSTGRYRINLAAADTNGNMVNYKFTASGCDDVDLHFITQS